MEPHFRKTSKGIPSLSDTPEARRVKSENRPWSKPLSSEEVLDRAKRTLAQNNGDPNNRKHLLGFFEIQFGIYRGQTFKWVLENSLGWAAYLVNSMKREIESGKMITEKNKEVLSNKQCFKEYMELFSSSRMAIDLKAQQSAETNATKQPTSSQLSATGPLLPTASQLSATGPLLPTASQLSATGPLLHTAGQLSATGPKTVPVSSLRSLLVGRSQDSGTLTRNIKRLIGSSKVTPSLATSRVRQCSVPSSSMTAKTDALAGCSSSMPHSESAPVELDDKTLMEEAAKVEKEHMTGPRVCLPAGWLLSLPEVDQRWISKELFRWSRTNQPELDIDKVDRMWWYPPRPSLSSSAIPSLEQYFGHPLFLWMPRKLWRVKLVCPHPDCGLAELTSAGIHQKIRQVIGLSSCYYMASEYLACKACKRKVIAWSHPIVSQLDIGHRIRFPCQLTGKLGCDIEVVRLMRRRGLGNSSSHLIRQLEEQHAERWLEQQIQFQTEYKGIVQAVASGLIRPVPLVELPAMPTVPKHRWLMQVYAQDVLCRLDELKASITSLYGQVLKLDSTKKIVRKLAGHARSTAAWATNVGNEFGQVIMSVLTASEGWGLSKMVDGLVNRYKEAGIAPPKILYTDRDCCGNSHLHKIFRAWPNLCIRLDVWHFMRRIATGCNTDSHALYSGFMAQLSRCIFVWDQSDLQRLTAAKRAELEARHMHPSDDDVMRNITKMEMQLHCRRAVRPTKEIEIMLEQLLEAYDGSCNSLGVPLINSERMTEIWKAQRHHIPCLQDPPGFQLYIQTGTVTKGGHVLPTYRCSRGSTSLESFHLHMNRFIPGTLASDTFFQAYLVDGLARWNEDRFMAAQGVDKPHSYSELIGIEYLYDQNNTVMQDYKLTLASMEAESSVISDEEPEVPPSAIEDPTVTSLDTIWPCKDNGSSAPVTCTPQSKASEATAAALQSPDTTASLGCVFPPPDTTLCISTASGPAASKSFAFTSTLPIQSRLCVVCLIEMESVGPDNVQGFKEVQDLADYLFKMKDHSLALTNEEASEIIALWSHLQDYDKKRTVYPPRYQETLSKGRFRATKKNVAPGVESTRRSFAGGRSPAQWPNCNRVCEGLFVRLCSEYRAARRIKGVRTKRWTLVIRDYLHIRQIVLNNASVMDKTTIQLPVINTATVASWYNKRERKQERSVLEQGIIAPATKITSASLPPAAVTKPVVPRADNPMCLYFHQTQQPLQTVSLALQCAPLPPRFILPAPSLVPKHQGQVPYTTQLYQQKKQKEEESGKRKRSYTRKSDTILCKYCEKDRNPATHHQYFGNWYCEATATQSLAEWRKDMEGRGYGRKKQKKEES
ncbi:hypothetical protein WMY93_009287 [Mugilogobius chulae]|uniref:DUF6729 domain-containing protein n=1 Tax=Mugilogobius chulae TaxID=88201 RepID=A0AAW0PLR6_9GOBI